MMAINFPDAPTTNQVFMGYKWDGEKWATQALVASVGAVRYDTVQGLTAAQQTQARQNIYAAPFDAMSYSGMQINGDGAVSQEYGTTSIYGGPAGTAVYKYICDGWKVASAGPQSISWASDPAVNSAPLGYLSSVGVWSNATNPSPGAGEYLFITHLLEGYRIAKLAWGTAGAWPLSIGFWVRSKLPGTYSLAIRSVPAALSYVTTFVVAATDTWEWKTVTIPGCTTGTWLTDNRCALEVDFTLMAGNNFRTAPGAWVAGNFLGATGAINGAGGAFRIAITGLIILPGIELPSAAQAPLVMRPYAEELITCMRYFERSHLSSAGSYAPFASGQCISGGRAQVFAPYKVVKRAIPAFLSGWVGGYGVTTADGSVIAVTAFPGVGCGLTAAYILCDVAGGLVPGNATNLYQNGAANVPFDFDARL